MSVVVQLGGLSAAVRSQGTDCRSAREDGPQQETVDQLELKFYEAQLELYDTKFEVLRNEEQLLVAQIDTVRRQIKGTRHTAPSAELCAASAPQETGSPRKGCPRRSL